MSKNFNEVGDTVGMGGRAAACIEGQLPLRAQPLARAWR
jgi:hypothetical protein